MQKTLGGNRLGSGNKMKVEMHDYGRSNQDPSYIFRSTMSAGTLVPFMSKVGQNGDTWDINLQCEVLTHPTVGPLFGSYKVQLDIFMAAVRLYQGQLHNNELGIGLRMKDIKLPILKMEAPVQVVNADNLRTIDNSQINPSSILAYLGLMGIGMANPSAPNTFREFNGIPLLAYWEIYKNYYANKQEEIGAVIHTPVSAPEQNVTAIKFNGNTLPQVPTVTPLGVSYGDTLTITYTGTQDLSQILIWNADSTTNYTPLTFGTLLSNVGGVATIQCDAAFLIGGGVTVVNWDYNSGAVPIQGEIQIAQFPLSNIDQMRKLILSAATSNSAFDIMDQDLQPYSYLVQAAMPYRSIMGSQEGLALKTYQSDLLNNWLSTEWIDGAGGINEITAIDTSGGSFTIDTLILSKKVYNMLNRIAVSGGSYNDWMDAVYMNERHRLSESPIYMGGLIKELVFQEVISNSQSADQPLGTLAGRGVLSNKHKGGHVVINVEELSYIMGIVSLTPRIDYSQGNSWDLHLKTMDDFHKPALDEIGFQELITEQMAWWDTAQAADGSWIQKSAGKQPAWLNYMTDINVVKGNFAINTNEAFMILLRRYEAEQADSFSAQIKDLTTYIDPRKFNHIFAQTTLDAQNFWVQIGVHINLRRKISNKLIPNL